MMNHQTVYDMTTALDNCDRGTPCARCGNFPPVDCLGVSESFDYCAVCDLTLCPSCMAEGCCGYKPADSGLDSDNPLPEQSWE